LGDCLGAGIVDHFSRDELDAVDHMKQDEEDNEAEMNGKTNHAYRAALEAESVEHDTHM